MADLLKTNALGTASQAMTGFGTITAPTGVATKYTTVNAPTFQVGDAVTSGGTTYYVASVNTTLGQYGFELSTIQGGPANFTSALTSPTFKNFFESQASDSLTGVAGLQNINVDVDAAATIAANSTAKSNATSSNVTGDSASLADINFNSGIQGSSLSGGSNTNLIDVASDAGLSGIATTTGSASASTSNGTASAFANLSDAAGIQDLDRLTVGGELTGLGKSLNTLSATAENVVGASNAASELSSKIEGFEGLQMGIKSDASLQGLAQFSNTAAASTSTGKADAEAFAEQLQGADLSGLMVGGTANVTGQATLSNLSAADAVTGNAEAESKMGTGAQGLVASSTLVDNGAATPVPLATAGLDVASDAGLTGLASITNNATAKTSAGSVDADAIGTSIQGANLNTVQIGGVGTIGGQATYGAKATAENVNGGTSDALADLTSVDGLKAVASLNIKSDATIQGLASITNDAMASGTAASGTGSTAIAEANVLKGADLFSDTDIGGIGSITGQVNFGSKATGENVTGNSLASASLGEQTAAGTFAPGKFSIASATQGTGATDNLFTTTDANKSNLSAGDKVTVSGVDYFVTTASASAGTFKLASSLDNALQGTALTAAQLTTAGISASSFTTSTLVNNEGGLAQGLVTGDATSGYGTDIKSDATIKGISGINLQAAANTTAGVADADAYAGTIDGASLGDVQIGGIGTLAGQSTFTGQANSSNVTGGASTADAKLLDADGMSAMANLKISSDGGITGLNTANLSAVAKSVGDSAGDAESATAQATATTLQGAELGQVTVGGIGNIVGQTSLTSLADGSNVTGAATGTGTLGTAEGLDLSGIATISSDATVKGIASINSVANAETTAGAATASATGSTINGADLSTGSAGLDIGGLGTIQGQANFAFTADASNVGGAAAEATAGSLYASSSDPTLTAKGLIGESTASGVYGIDVASDATLSGMAIGSLKANASSTAQNATARSGDGDSATGADLPSLNVGGLANLTGAAQLDSASIAESVGGVSTALAGQGQKVTGLTSFGEVADATWTPVTPGTAAGATPLSSRTFDTDLNINVASDATLTAQGFSNLDATATSTAGGAVADAGSTIRTGSGTVESPWVNNASSTVTGIADGMDINIGGVGNLTALAQGTADASAESVTGLADAFGAQSALGIKGLEMKTASDDTLKSTASVVGSANATTTGNHTDDFAAAGIDFDATGINGLAMQAGGLGNLTATGSVTGNADATSVAAPADARGEIDAMGLQDAWFSSASDGNITGMGIINSGIHATSTASTANSEGDFDATGIKTLEAGIGGISTLKGQAQVKADVSAESVSGNVNAYSGANLGDSGLSGAFDMTGNVSSITGLDSIELAGKSDGTILGTASGAFTTSAESVLGNATANAAQTLRGINTLNLDLGGNGGINAIVNDTNFVEAHSVSGNATAVASVDAIGLNGGNIHIAGNASIMANVGVDSKAEAGTIG